MSEKLENLQKAITRIKNKEHKFIFLVPDTNGIARASVAVIYHHALTLHKQGLNVMILHEKENYMKVGAWMNEEYDNLPHISIESNKLDVSAADFLIIPEIFGNIVEKITRIPCQKIVFVQSLEYMFDSYSPGKSWIDYNIYETMTTSIEAKQNIEDLLYVTNVKVAPIGVPDTFKPYKKLKKPVVAIHCKEPRKTAKLLKMFYLKYPYLRWVVFRDMHGMTQEDFARNLSECILSLWSDQTSTFPLFLLESMKCNLPVVAQVPQLIQEWVNDKCASWVYTDEQMIEIAAIFIKSWLEDHVPEEFSNVSELVEGKFTMAEMESSLTKIYDEYMEERINILTKMVDKLAEEENNTETPETNDENN
jgi:glycosyltransferase involved in cell wall biosynthesis